ncbi:MAG: hypothetical protein ACR2GY_09545 [Phycisphaerales bacterium]
MSATPESHTGPFDDDVSLKRTVRDLEDAIVRDQLSIANSLAAAIDRPPVSSLPIVAEAVARLRIAQGRPDLAARRLEHVMTTEGEVLRALCLILSSQRGEAHAALQQIVEHNRAEHVHPAARQLLAMLEWDCHHHERALAILREQPHGFSDPVTLSLLILLSLERGDAAEARINAQRLARLEVFPIFRQSIHLFLASLGLARSGPPQLPHHRIVLRLTEELREAQHLLPILLEAQRREFDSASARLLMLALAGCVEELADQAGAYEAIIELTLTLDGPQAARSWLDAALQRLPMSAAIRQLESRLESVLESRDVGVGVGSGQIDTPDQHAEQQGRAA